MGNQPWPQLQNGIRERSISVDSRALSGQLIIVEGVQPTDSIFCMMREIIVRNFFDRAYVY